YGYVLKGTLEIAVGSETFTLHEGESMGFDSMIPHVLRNVGDGEFEGIWFVHGRERGVQTTPHITTPRHPTVTAAPPPARRSTTRPAAPGTRRPAEWGPAVRPGPAALDPQRELAALDLLELGEREPRRHLAAEPVERHDPRAGLELGEPRLGGRDLLGEPGAT